MKLPIFQPANTALPTRSAQGGATVDPTGAGLAQIGSDLMQAGRQFGVIAGQQAREQDAEDARAERLRAAAEKAKQAQLDDIDALTALNTATAEMDLLERDLKQGQRDPDTDAITTPPAGPREYVSEHEKRAQVVREKLLSQTRTPGADVMVQKGAVRLFGDRLLDARKYSDTLAVDKYKSAFEQNVEDMERRIAGEMDPERRAALEEELAGAFKRAQGMIPLTALQARARQSEERIDTVHAQRLAATDPEAAIEGLKAGQYRLPQEKADALAEQIGTKWKARVHQADADQRRMETEMDRWWKEQQQLTVSDAVLKASRGAYTLEQLEEDARDWRLHREDITAIRAAIERPEKPVKAQSDPATLDRVIADTHSQFPKMTEKDLLGLRTNGLLSVGDWKAALDRLRETREGLQREARAEGERGEGRRRSEAERLDTRARSIAKDRHGQAEQELRAELGIPTLFDKLDPAKEKAWAAALQELRGRSNAYDGKEDPLTVREDIAPRYKKLLGTDAQLTEEQLRKLLLFPTPAALEAAKTTLPQATYRQQQDLFRQLTEAVGTRRKMLEESGTKPGGTMGRK